MSLNQQSILTQAQLIEELRSLGYGDSSETRVALWRKSELLPPFDGGGSGQGRGCGREKCFWTSRDVVERAGLSQIYSRLTTVWKSSTFHYGKWVLRFH